MIRHAVWRPYCRPLAGLVWLVVGSASALGQPREERPRENPPEREPRAYPPEREPSGAFDNRYPDDRHLDYDSEPPYDYYERYWRREARDYGRARDRWSRSDHWRYDRPGWRRYDDDAWYDDYGDGGGAFDEGYWEGRRDGRRYAEWERRYELGRRSYAEAMSDGVAAFRNAEYSQAVRHFIRAAKLNQGDPASRIHAAHAMVAIGRYQEALPALRRAFQLQPKIAYLALDIRRDYGPKADFDAHLKALADAAREAEDDPALWLLLGYYQFFSGRESQALASLTKADELAAGDFMTDALLDAARMVAPASKPPPKPKPGDKGKPPTKPEGKKPTEPNRAPTTSQPADQRETVPTHDT